MKTIVFPVVLFFLCLNSVYAQKSDVDLSRPDNIRVGFDVGAASYLGTNFHDMPDIGQLISGELMFYYNEKHVDEFGYEYLEPGNMGMGGRYIDYKAEDKNRMINLRYIGLDIEARIPTTESQKSFLSLTVGCGAVFFESGLSDNSGKKLTGASSVSFGYHGRLCFETRIYKEWFISPGIDILYASPASYSFFDEFDHGTYDDEVSLGVIGAFLGLKFNF